MKRPTTLFATILLLFFSTQCTINGDGLPDINPSVCNDQVPIVMVHGFLASGDTYAKQIQRFIANGVCQERMFTFDWNSLGTQDNTGRLNNFISTILEETGAPYVYLAGHSAGGGLGYDLLRFEQQAGMVAKYVHLASIPRSEPAGPNGEVPTLNIYSSADPISSGADIPGAINVNLIDKDHYQVATSLETFIEMYEFFFEESPDVTDLFDPSETYEIRGKALSFGENLPSQGAQIEIYALEPGTGFRISDAPQFSFRAGPQGFWGPIEIEADTYYEFLIYTGLPGDRPVHYYREPFRFEDPTVYLRSYPPLFSLGSLFLSGLPKKDEMATVAFFGASQAAVSGRDILKVNGSLLSTPELTSQEQSIIAMFLYDGGDGITSLESDPSFEAFPFLAGADAFFQTETPQTIQMEFNGRIINMRNWPSASDGVSVAVFR